MSTWYPYRVPCPVCGVVNEVRLLKGLHISRLPAVKAQIRNGTFQACTCAGCGNTVQIEAPSVYTDFPNGQYIAVEPPFPESAQAARDRCRGVYDACFTFGPDVAANLGASMRHRVAFGVAALREKVLIWDAGLDDRVVEGLKLEALAEGDLAREGELLRLTTILSGGHLLFVRLLPPEPTDRVELEAVEGGAIPPGSPSPAGGERAFFHRGASVQGYVTLPERRYQQRLMRRASLLQEHPWLADEWLVDAFLGQPRAAG